ncbi:hypothetical protein L1987_01056 [Smallanthus sonchifolius]|uniref:Uncharacterized protein n=1 Tax=Smallanthus sonchifolius TaxID=185202 RepID=A0ACB9K3V4_9ASTR|nr:hypothetical protein L1987_01056 [Smallanthus sonchifolius]
MELEKEKIVQKEKEKVIEKQKEKEQEKEKPKEIVYDYFKANFPKEDETKRLRLIEEFVNKGYKRESVYKCTKTLLLNMEKKMEENQALRERLTELEKAKKRILEVGSSNYNIQKDLFETRLKELDAKKLKPNVNVRRSLQGDIFIIYRTRGKHQVFKNGGDILKLHVTDLKVLAGIKMLTSHPKGYDFESNLRKLSKDGFNAFKRNTNVTQRKMTRFRYNVEDAVARKPVRNKAPTAILPQYNEEYSKNSESLQPFTRACVDDMDEPVVERGDNMEPLRMYEMAQMRTLIQEDIFALTALEIAHRLQDEFYLIPEKIIDQFNEGRKKKDNDLF